jgi:hypothetical protein
LQITSVYSSHLIAFFFLCCLYPSFLRAGGNSSHLLSTVSTRFHSFNLSHLIFSATLGGNKVLQMRKLRHREGKSSPKAQMMTSVGRKGRGKVRASVCLKGALLDPSLPQSILGSGRAPNILDSHIPYSGKTLVLSRLQSSRHKMIVSQTGHKEASACCIE